MISDFADNSADFCTFQSSNVRCSFLPQTLSHIVRKCDTFCLVFLLDSRKNLRRAKICTDCDGDCRSCIVGATSPIGFIVRIIFYSCNFSNLLSVVNHDLLLNSFHSQTAESLLSACPTSCDCRSGEQVAD